MKRRMLSVLLAIAMLMSMIPMNAMAETVPEIYIDTTNVGTLKAGDEFSVSVSIKDNPGICLAYLEFDIPSIFTYKSITNDSAAATCTYANNKVSWEYTSDFDVDYTQNGSLFTLTFAVNADATNGEYEIGVGKIGDVNENLGNVDGNVSATFRAGKVKVGEIITTDYEIYYTLTNTEDTEKNGETAAPDGYKEYDISATDGNIVTANVWLVNKGADTINLQAYDIFLSYDESLKYKTLNMTGAKAYKNAVDATTGKGVVAGEGETVVHIQAIGGDFTAVALEQNKAVSLGTITFTIDGTAAVYDDPMDITLTGGKDKENVTNISAATKDAATGDTTSYYPTVTQTVTVDGVTTTYKGAEIDTKHTVTFDTDDGSNVAAQEVGHNLTATKPEDPTKANHSFEGWFANEGLTTAYAFNEKVTADITIYAKWEATAYTVNWYDADNGLIYSDTINSGKTTSFDEKTYTKPSKAHDEQYTYTFKGWIANDTPELNGKIETFPYEITAPTNFYPVFSTTTVEYEVKYMPETGDNALHTEQVAYGDNPTWTAGKATKTGDAQYSYEFLGWTETPNPAFEAAVVDLTTFEVKKATIFYPVFKQITNSYTVTYNPGQNGTFDEEDALTETVPYGSSPKDVPTVTANAGYEFTGWYDTTNSKEVADITNYVVNGAVTLTAQYKGKEITVKFDGNGADQDSPTMQDQTWTYGTDFEMPANAFVKTYWTFNGWNTKSDGSGTSYTVGNKYNDLTTEGEITLYAQWTQADLTITYAKDLIGGSVGGNEAANHGDTITVTVTPLPGYNVGEVTYTPDGGTAQKIEANENDEYIFTMPNANVEITATFTAISYDVTVDETVKDNVDVDKKTATVEDTVTVTVTAPDGYDIATVTYVKTDDETATPVEIKAEDGTYKFKMQPYNVTVSATFSGKSYEIVYNANGGSGTMGNSEATFGTDATLTANAFTKTGYNFIGWDTAEAGTNVVHADKATNVNPTTYANPYKLYAVWKAKKVDVILDYGYEGVEAGSLEVTYGSTYSGLEDAERAGYTFLGWFDSEGKEVDSTNTVIKETKHTLYAKWDIITYTITYKEADGTQIGETDSYTVEDTVTLRTKDEVTKTGYTFVSWHTDAGLTSEAVSTIEKGTTGDKTYYAKWEVTPYTITLNPAGGTIANMTANEDGNYTLSYNIITQVPLPEATSGDPMYKFTGWKVTIAAGTWEQDKISNANKLTPINAWGNVTLTAVYGPAADYEVEQYLYARDGMYMLRVANDLTAGQVYQFNGETMYYIEDAGYQVGDITGTFYTLIDKSYVGTDKKLTKEAYALLKSATADHKTINYNGDINGDTVLNIADANIVYQMVQLKKGDYYSETQLTVEQRLAADMNKEEYIDGEYRGTTEDVDAIVKLINKNAVTN